MNTRDLKHEIEIIKPYDALVTLIAVVVWSGLPSDEAVWILYDGNGCEIGRGYSWRSKIWDNNHQAMLNCKAAARRYVRKMYPLFCGRKKVKKCPREATTGLLL